MSEEKLLKEVGDEISSCLGEDVNLEGGVAHPLEELEELRLFLGSMLKPELLGSLVGLYKALSNEPRQVEMYSWFVRNSSAGSNCRYARMALRKFKEERIDLVEGKLEEALEAIRSLREDG